MKEETNMENGSAEKKAARELVSISIVAHPEYSGKTTTTDKRFGDGKHKFSITVPVPETDDDAQAIYGVSMASLIEAGVIQKWYGARDVDNVITEAAEKSQDPNSQDVIDLVTLAASEQKFSAKERVSQTKELKSLKNELSGLGMSAAEAIALLKKMKAQA
jgi:hypothetical protein